jgi:uncharacterized alkaline shock family protein YloU
MTEKDMAQAQGKTTIDPGVLVEISKLAALSVPGVTGLMQNTETAAGFLSKGKSTGIKIDVENNTVYVDLYLTLANDIDLYQTSQDVQDKVSRSIMEMVGMEVGHINIHIEDVTFA